MIGRRTVALALLAATAILPPAVPAASAATCAVPRTGDSPLVDAARAVPDGEETGLVATLSAYRKVSGAVIVAATVPSHGSRPLESYTRDLFNCWGVGDRGSDNGVLILLAMKERRVRLQVGRGLETVVSDRVAAEIIRDRISPALRTGDVTQGFIQGANGVVAAIFLARGRAGDTTPRPTAAPPPATFQDAPYGDTPRADDLVDRVLPGFDLPTSPRGIETPSGLGPFVAIVTLLVVAGVVGGLAQAGRSIGRAVGALGSGFSRPWAYHSGRSHDWADAARQTSSFTGAAGFAPSGSGPSGGSGSGGSFGGGQTGGGGASGSW